MENKFEEKQATTMVDTIGPNHQPLGLHLHPDITVRSDDGRMIYKEGVDYRIEDGRLYLVTNGRLKEGDSVHVSTGVVI